MTRSHSIQHRSAPFSRQRGMAAIMLAVLLITGVIIILGQSLGIIGVRSVDTAQQRDSTAALTIAESGLQRAQGIVGAVADGGLMSDATCTGVGAGGPFIVSNGGVTYGSFSYGTSVSSPPSCNGVGGTLCDTCQVTVTGTVGSASRTLSQVYNIGVSNGTAGRGQTVTMVLKNTYDVPAMALFNLAWKRQDPGGNADTTFCANGATGCGLQWNLESSSGNTSIGGMGVSVDIAANTLSKVVVQNISMSRDYVEVGALFPSTTSAATPVVTGSFWDDKNVSHLTATTSGSTGGVISGVATTAATCTSSPATYPTSPPGSYQLDTCTNWCRGGDTLVFGVSGRSASSADQITTVTFNVSGSTPQRITLTRVAHFPNLDGSTLAASGKAYSEVWYAANPDYMSSTAGAGLTSYTAAVKAIAGTTITLSANMSNGDTVMPVGSMTADSELCVGDTLSSAASLTGATITSTPGGTCSSASGSYGVSTAATGNVNKNTVHPVVATTKLRVLGATGTLSAGATNNGAVAIASGPDGSGNYTMSAARTFSTSYVTQGADSTTIHVPAGTSLPSVGTLVALFSLNASPPGTGSLAAGVKVLSTGADSFTISGATPGMVGATVCGGTCAFFNSPSDASASNVTQFTINKSTGTQQWASGFMCLKGVDASRITPVTSTTLTTGRWQETVQ